jgi:hypothetical protein
MAGPWHPCYMVNISSDVTSRPRQRLAVWRQTGHSNKNPQARSIWAATEENIPDTLSFILSHSFTLPGPVSGAAKQP